MAEKQNLNSSLNDGERMMKRRRGRPKKSADANPEDVRSITKPVRYTSKEWEEVKDAMEKKNAKNFNKFAREATMDKRAYIIDSDAAKELRAARKDIIIAVWCNENGRKECFFQHLCDHFRFIRYCGTVPRITCSSQ